MSGTSTNTLAAQEIRQARLHLTIPVAYDFASQMLGHEDRAAELVADVLNAGHDAGGPSSTDVQGWVLNQLYRRVIRIKASANATPDPANPLSILSPERRAAVVAHDVMGLDNSASARALFYRASFGSGTERLVFSGGDITWENNSKGIVRYIPEIDRYDVIKTISSPSYTKSSIYPITVGGRLYAIRDWGSEWTSKDKHFGIEELDPVTGLTIASTDINAEWFTIAGDNIYYMSEVKTDLFGKRSGGGHLMVKNLATGDGSQIADNAVRFRAIGGSLISIGDSGVSKHSPTTGIARPVAPFDSALLEDIWPHIGRTFTGDSAIYWAAERRPGVVDVIALYSNGETKAVAEIEFDPDEKDLVVDEHDGLVLIGAISSSHGRGLAVTSAFTLTPGDGEVSGILLEGFIGSSKADAGGGIQLLKLP